MLKYSGCDVMKQPGFLYSVYDRNSDDLYGIKIVVVANQPRRDSDDDALIQDNRFEVWQDWKHPPYADYNFRLCRIANVDPSELLWINSLPISAKTGSDWKLSDEEKKHRQIWIYVQIQGILQVTRPEIILFAGAPAREAFNSLCNYEAVDADHDLRQMFAAEGSLLHKGILTKDQIKILCLRNEKFDRVVPIVETKHPSQNQFHPTSAAEEKIRNIRRAQIDRDT